MITYAVRSPNLYHVASAVIFCFFLIHCSDKANTGSDQENSLIPAVEAVQARFGALPLTERFSGLARARNQIDIYPEVSAIIVSVHVENGDFVKRGQPLVTMRDAEFRDRYKQSQASFQITEAQLKQAEARLLEVRSTLERIQSLSEQGLASAAEMEEVQTNALAAEADVALAHARVAQAQASLDERRELLGQTTVRAPISGRVGNRRAEVGMLVNSNMRLFTLGQMDSMRIEIILTDKMINYIEKGQRAEIDPGGSPVEVLSAPLTRISPFLHPVTHTTVAEIDLANRDGKLLSGMFVTVDVFYGESEEATLVPLSALYDNPNTGETGVYVSQQALNREPVGRTGDGQTGALSDPVKFNFVPVDIIAKGRMEAGIRGVDRDMWVVTLGQDLLGGGTNTARVRTVEWAWVEELQQLQREDLLEEIMQKQQAAGRDTTMLKPMHSKSE